MFNTHKNIDLYNTNQQILAKWKEYNLFWRSVEEREGCPEFVFFEGPPSANGHPGIHHVLARTIKDTFNRYKTMKGYQVKRKAGWDTHGLPVELGVEKELGITKNDIDNKDSEKYISTADYNAKCRSNVMIYTDEWTELTEKMGYWVDLDNPYITYDNKYIETLWWLLKQLYNKDLLYKGYTIQPYSPAAGTGLSSHELNQPGCYRDVKDTTCTAQFLLKNVCERLQGKGELIGEMPVGLKTYILAWTTTPWTLPSNTALCVGPKIDYVAVVGSNPYTNEEAIYILAEARLSAYFAAKKDEEGKENPLQIVWRGKGNDLVGLHYQQLMPWVKPCALENNELVVKEAEAFRVIPGDYVTTEDGTGIVHIAPTFGADDAKVAKDAGIPSLFIIDKGGDTRPMVDFQGKYFVAEDMDEKFRELCVNETYWKHSGEYVKPGFKAWFTKDDNTSLDEAMKALKPEDDLNLAICMEMKQEGTVFKIEKHFHNYPHCWRTDLPILYYPLDSWFIRSTAKKERMVELNKTINWKPESTGTGRFGNWLENLNDWNLSRSRYWGTPLPIWRNRDTKEELCIGSVEELYNEIDKAVAAGVMQSNPLKDKGFVPGDNSKENYDRIDLHRPYVDDIVLVSESGKPMTRETDLIDVWFDSGAMPYAQIHYPFENKELIDEGKAFPADFINEGVDQTRGWFFTLHAIATMVFDSVAFKNVISSGLVLDAKGNKMSKRLGNAVNPFDTLKNQSTDATRFYMLTNSQPWDNLKFDPKGVDEIRRKFFGTLFNTYSFFALYANVDGFNGSEKQVPLANRPEIDRWILSELNTLIKNVDEALADYEPTRAGRFIDGFVNDYLSNWYVRLNRKRFWGKDMSQDKLAAYQTLYQCLKTIALLLAPFSPFYADELYNDLLSAGNNGGEFQSVHLAKFPEVDTEAIDKDLEQRMQMAQQITSMVLALRRKVNIKVRQPLQKILVPAMNDEQKAQLLAIKELVLNEVNVKEMECEGGENLLVKKVKCNLRVLGKTFGKQMKAVAAQVDALNQQQIAALEKDGTIEIRVEGAPVVIEIADVEVISQDIPGWEVANEGALTVAMETELTPELINEGMARELINRIQNIRKESGLEITDRINITVSANENSDAAVAEYGEYICQQVLGDIINIADNDGQEVDFDEFKLNIKIEK